MIGVYALLFYKKNLYAVKYGEGLELVGGRTERGEGLREAMIRELSEEALIEEESVETMEKLEKTYVYESERAGGEEKHYFFKVVVDEKPRSGDCEIVKTTEEELLGTIQYRGRKLLLKQLFEEVERTIG